MFQCDRQVLCCTKRTSQQNNTYLNDMGRRGWVANKKEAQRRASVTCSGDRSVVGGDWARGCSAGGACMVCVCDKDGGGREGEGGNNIFVIR